MDYHLNKEFRKSVSIKIKNGQVYVSAPKFYPNSLIQQFVDSKIPWINKHLAKQQNINPRIINFIAKKESEQKILFSVQQLSQNMNLKYTQIKFSNAKNYWGFCKQNNSISINWRLGFAPTEVMEYVIIHELAHIVHKNHSTNFWNLVAKFDPNWKMNRKKLKEISTQLHAIVLEP